MAFNRHDKHSNDLEKEENEKELPFSNLKRAKDIPPGQIVINDDGTYAVMK